MSPITHFLAGWAIASAAPLNLKDRALITIAGIVPDIDGLGILVDFATHFSSAPTDFWGRFHHVLAHTLTFGIVFTLIAGALATRKTLCVLLVLASFHLHLVCDVMGARGPDGYQWPIPYFNPFSSHPQWTWSGQWALNSWQNLLLTFGLILWTGRVAIQKGISPLIFFSRKADHIFVTTLRQRFGGARKSSNREV